jgi:hypothetical protein
MRTSRARHGKARSRCWRLLKGARFALAFMCAGSEAASFVDGDVDPVVV